MNAPLNLGARDVAPPIPLEFDGTKDDRPFWVRYSPLRFLGNREAAPAKQSRRARIKSAKPLTLSEKIGIVTSIITAATAIAAGGKYVFGIFSPIRLEIGLPPIIEFRCSNTRFDGYECLRAEYPQSFNVTLTAALLLRAIGESTKDATITHATATIERRGAESELPAKLTWLWSADFVPGQAFQRKQVTAMSLSGGESKSQEMWFFPMQEHCGTKNAAECPNSSKNFVTWLSFLSSIAGVDHTKPLKDTAFEIAFNFKYREGEDRLEKEKEILCELEVTDVLKRMADPSTKGKEGVLLVSAPCIPFERKKTTPTEGKSKSS